LKIVYFKLVVDFSLALLSVNALAGYLIIPAVSEKPDEERTSCRVPGK